MTAEFLTPQDPRWAAFLSHTCHDFYHLPDYVEFAARTEGGTAVAFYAEIDGACMLAPLLLRNVPDWLNAPPDWRDATTPYGFPTPLITPNCDISTCQRLLETFREVGRAQGLISAFFRLHPLLPLPEAALQPYGKLVNHGPTVSIDLTLSVEEMLAQTCSNHRQNIRRLRRNGFQTEINQWEQLATFGAIYRQTMARCSADSFYLFSDAYFEELHAVLANRLYLATVVAANGEIAAGGLFTTVDGIVQAHLCGTDQNYLFWAPVKLLFDDMRQWAKKEGYQVLHLGGGVGAHTDSLFQFKAGFSNCRHTYLTYRMILNEERYRSLEHYQATQTPALDSDFFPIYRCPAARPIVQPVEAQ